MSRIEARLKMYLVHLHPADVRKRLQKVHKFNRQRRFLKTAR
jgi:hypothetical protein